MLGIYFSGTGNTRYAVERFVSLVDSNAPCYSIEDENVAKELPKHETVVFGFPVYYSNLPKIAKDFITDNKDLFAGKKVFIIATKALHNAYGVGFARKKFIDCGAEFLGSLQPKMPENIRDLWITMLYTGEKLDRNMVKRADKKIMQAAEMFKNGTYTKSGLTPINFIVGTLLRWLPFYPKTDKYILAPKVNADKCDGCGKCVTLCPMHNISLVDNSVAAGSKCTVCYRCCNSCPKQALTVLGNKVYGQYSFYESKGRGYQ
jgi:NAD-dependent dihydropyrimidine dehydrogenase PreA subunit/flavodoxin